MFGILRYSPQNTLLNFPSSSIFLLEALQDHHLLHVAHLTNFDLFSATLPSLELGHPLLALPRRDIPTFLVLGFLWASQITLTTMKTQASLATAATLFASLASAVEYLEIDGSNFVNSVSGDRFDIIGVT